jgi:ribosome-binding ATPase YchF (GTP1/OBG family)
MKIATFGLDIDPGKYKYRCESFDKLAEKFSPQKVTPYAVEFIGGEYDQCDAVVFDLKKKFDFVFLDIEKVDKRKERSEDEKEKALLNKVSQILEKETLLCDAEFNEEETTILRTLALLTLKPCIGKEDVSDINSLIEEVIDKAGMRLFFTVGKREVRAWDIKKGDTAVEAAARIHSDLARGFIKADVVNVSLLDEFFNMNEARARGFVKVVDKDYIVEEGDIIEIRFNV